MPYAVATYTVFRRARVHERRTSILQSTGPEELRLQTSTIPQSEERLIIFARLNRIMRR